MYSNIKNIYDKAIAEGKSGSISAKDSEGNDIIIQSLITQEKDGKHFFRVDTMQSDGTTRINDYYENGDVKEAFEK